MPRPLEALRWDNSFARLPNAFFERVAPTPLSNVALVAFNPEVAALLDLDPAERPRPEFLALFNGKLALPGLDPLAAIYAGHQFGTWVPQLGDGRAILLGEVIGANHQRWDVQVKGAGLTRFSRMGDGRAVLRSTVREYLAGEAMHALGIPSTRSLAIIGSDEPVYRERTETGALLVRVARSHVRFGSFELFASREQHAELRQLADYVIDEHFPQLLMLPAAPRYAAWFRDVVERTARLMAAWTATGFTHGVMNTDNMSILGITLDYGPYGWLDAYDRSFIPNHADRDGRYAFDQQPRIGLWNCVRLGEALHSIVNETDAMAALDAYRAAFESEMDRLMRAKLGLGVAESDDVALVGSLLAMLHENRADYTRFFRALSRYTETNSIALHAEVSDAARLNAWLEQYRDRLQREGPVDAERHARMLGANPKYILRNWMAQDAITNAEAGNFARIEELRVLLSRPFDEQPEHELYAGKPPAWAAGIEISCSS